MTLICWNTVSGQMQRMHCGAKAYIAPLVVNVVHCAPTHVVRLHTHDTYGCTFEVPAIHQLIVPPYVCPLCVPYVFLVCVPYVVVDCRHPQ